MTKSISIKRLPKFEVEINLWIPWNEIKETYDKVVVEVSKNLQVKGFRKGKVPKKIVEENLDKNKVYSLVIQEALPKYYQKAIQENNLKPLVNPRISITSAKEGKDWEIKILVCEKPTVKLDNYKQEVRKINKAGRIWLPGKDQEQNPNEDQKKTKDEKIQKIIKWLVENIKLELSDLIIEEEVNHKLSQLIDQTAKIGLTVEQYLSSTGKNPESLKAEYRKQAEELWKIGLILDKIADEEEIVVDRSEIDELVQKSSSEEERKALESQKYFLASILRRQKTLDFLAKL